MVILAGGSHGSKHPDGYRLFLRQLDRSKPILYIGLAQLPSEYIASFGGFASRLAADGFCFCRLCESPEFLRDCELSDYTAIYCDGGNTFRLMQKLRMYDNVRKIREYVKNGGTWYGSSAGAVVGGADIQPIIYIDSNCVVLRDTSGLDFMDGWSTVAHFNDSEQNDLNTERNDAVAELAKDYPKLIGLAEETTVVIDGGRRYMLGQPCVVYESGVQRIVGSGEEF